MAKACIKKDLQNLENEIDDLIMLEDSTRGTLCAIHKTIHSSTNFPCTKHKMMRLCAVPRMCSPQNMRVPISRSKRKAHSSGPPNDRLKMSRALSVDPYQRPCYGSGIVAPVASLCSNYVNVEKAISCPEKMCCQRSLSHGNCMAPPKSNFQINEFAQSLINTDEVVCELKGEIERVKHQLHHISQQKCQPRTKSPNESKDFYSRSEDLQLPGLVKLKSENKRLKREIEAKRKLLEKSKGDVEKAKEILMDYEKKVTLLHVQALKSSKAMKVSKEKFFTCLTDRDDKIKNLKEAICMLETKLKKNDDLLHEKERELNNLNKSLDMLKKSFEETSAQCSVLTESNQHFCESVERLQDQLSNASTEITTQKETIKKLEQRLCELNSACKKVASRTKRQKECFENQIKNHHEEKVKMTEQISELSTRLVEFGVQKRKAEELGSKCENLEKKIKEYEHYSYKCKNLEDELKELHGKLVNSEDSFRKDKEEMHQLITELTTVVQANQVTISQMSEINQHQEKVIKTQSMALLSKEEQLKLIEKESEHFKVKNVELEKVVENLKKSLSEPCSRDACLCVSRELEECRNALNVEKDTKLLKEQIINDQSQTILNLQTQVKEKIFELNKAQSDTMYLEEEISKINEKLIRKHKELDREVDEKENLIEKLRILECQRNQLTEEIEDFEDILHGFKETCGDNEKRQTVLIQLEDQIRDQKQQWEIQKEVMVKEKRQAVCAAKFATQKLLDTVADFQRQVDAQKKVQLLLTKMLHEKDQQLRIVTSKISNINTITKDIIGPCDRDTTMKELFVRRTLAKHLVPSDMNMNSMNTSTSIYSSCSSCGKRSDCTKRTNLAKTEKPCRAKENNAGGHCTAPCASPRPALCLDPSQFLQLLNNNIDKIQEEPSRD